MAVFTAAAGTAFNADNFGTYQPFRGEGDISSQQIETALNWVDTNLNSFRMFQTLWYDNNGDGTLLTSDGDYLMGRVDYTVILPAPVIPDGQTEVTAHASGTTTARFIDLTTNTNVGTLTQAPYDLDITASNASGSATYYASYINPAFALFSGDDTVTLGDLGDYFYDPDGSLKIDMGGGDDFLVAMGGGADTVHGGAGDDLIRYFNAGHLIFGDDGNDVIVNGDASENDQVITTFSGGAGNDSVQGTSGDDLFIEGAGSGDDVLDGGSGFDTVDYSGAAAAVQVILQVFGSQSRAPDFFTGIARGGSGKDYLIYIDNVIGSQFGDRLAGDSGTNVLTGFGGADRLLGGAGADHLDGGAGRDTAQYSDDFIGVTVSLMTGLGSGGVAEGDVLVGIENLSGGLGSDVLTGNRHANLLDGGAYGQDTLLGLGGDDRLIGGTGADQLSGGSGNDTLTGGMLGGEEGSDTLQGGLGDDHFVFLTALDSPTFQPDIITDFAQIAGNRDHIDLSALDTPADLNAPFVLTGHHGHGRFTGTAGELRLNLGTRNTSVQIDLDGDGVRDMDILVKDMLTLTGHDFIL